MTEIQTIEGGQKDVLLRRANIYIFSLMIGRQGQQSGQKIFVWHKPPKLFFYLPNQNPFKKSLHVWLPELLSSAGFHILASKTVIFVEMKQSTLNNYPELYYTQGGMKFVAHKYRLYIIFYAAAVCPFVQLKFIF